MNQINFKELPFYIKFTFKLLMILLLGLLLIQGQGIIVPFIFSILLSILLLPFVNFLVNKLLFPKSIAVLTAVILSLAIIGTVIYFFSHQIAGFLKDIPSIRDHLQVHYQTLQTWVQTRFHISTEQQSVMLNSNEQCKKFRFRSYWTNFFYYHPYIVFYYHDCYIYFPDTCLQAYDPAIYYRSI